MTDQNRELLAWAAEKIQDAQLRKITGELRIQMHEGHIQRIRHEAVYSAPKCAEKVAG